MAERSSRAWSFHGGKRHRLDPLLDLGLRLGEGSGTCLALPLIEAAARILGKMATFDSTGVNGRSRPEQANLTDVRNVVVVSARGGCGRGGRT